MNNTNTGTLKSPIGELKFTMTDAGHVHIEADGAIVNRVTYRVSCHVHLIDGVWKMRDFRELYLSRQGSYDEPTWAARKKAGEIVTAAWIEFVASANFSTIATVAERGHLEREIERADEKIVELEEKLAAARKERADFRKKLGAL